MRVTVKVEVREIGNGFGRAAGCNLTRTHETSETLGHLDVHQMGRMKLVLVSQEAGLNPGAKRCLQQKLQESRRVQDDHADSRSSRMTTAAGVFKVRRLRP